MTTPDIDPVSVLLRAARDTDNDSGHAWYFTVWARIAERHGTHQQYPANPEYGFHAFELAEQDLINEAHAEALKMNSHTITIVPAPKMDTPNLVAAECSCGTYRSGSTTENGARKRGDAHVIAKTEAREQ